MKINLIIATYGALPEKHSNNNLKKDYLKINLQCLNHVKTNIDKISKVFPKDVELSCIFYINLGWRS